MKTISRNALILLFGFSLSPAHAVEADGAPPKPQYSSLTPAYRMVTPVVESYISPFRKPEARAAQIAAQNASRFQGPNLPAVHGRLRELKVTGVIPSTAKRQGVLLLGDQLYSEGEEIVLPDARGKFDLPLLEGHRVTLRSVSIDTVVLRVAAKDSIDEPAVLDLAVRDLLEE